MTSATTRPAPIRCAIYTRKSTEEGLEQEFNSLDAQRESAEAYIASMKHEGWVCIPDRYDDGGFTGGNIERPALRRLMADIEAGRVDCIVVYKVDRLSRSLLDFARLMEVFDRKRVSFVAVTQQFNTTQSMGRLTLNILLSFAQFEREIISERTRDKIAAARRKGRWSGGRPVLGYRVDPANRRLVVDEGEAPLLREIFAMYDSGRSLLEIARDLNGRGVRTKLVVGGNGRPYGGREWDKATVQKTLTNPLYVGLVRYKRETHPGEHEALVDRDLWDRVQRRLRERGSTGGMHIRNKHGALLKGLLRCGCCGAAMGHVYTTKAGKRNYGYYRCQTAQKRGRDACRCQSLPADEVEAFVVEQIRRIGSDPALRSQTLAELRSREREAVSGVEDELVAVRGDLKRARAEVTSAARKARTDPGAAGTLPALHGRVAELEERALVLERAIEDASVASITKTEVDAALGEFTGAWSALTADERARLLRLAIREVVFDSDKGTLGIALHPAGLRALAGGQMEIHEEAA